MVFSFVIRCLSKLHNQKVAMQKYMGGFIFLNVTIASGVPYTYLCMYLSFGHFVFACIACVMAVPPGLLSLLFTGFFTPYNFAMCARLGANNYWSQGKRFGLQS